MELFRFYVLTSELRFLFLLLLFFCCFCFVLFRYIIKYFEIKKYGRTAVIKQTLIHLPMKTLVKLFVFVFVFVFKMLVSLNFGFIKTCSVQQMKKTKKTKLKINACCQKLAQRHN